MNIKATVKIHSTRNPFFQFFSSRLSFHHIVRTKSAINLKFIISRKTNSDNKKNSCKSCKSVFNYLSRGCSLYTHCHRRCHSPHRNFQLFLRTHEEFSSPFTSLYAPHSPKSSQCCCRFHISWFHFISYFSFVVFSILVFFVESTTIKTENWTTATKQRKRVTQIYKLQTFLRDQDKFVVWSNLKRVTVFLAACHERTSSISSGSERTTRKKWIGNFYLLLFFNWVSEEFKDCILSSFSFFFAYSLLPFPLRAQVQNELRGTEQEEPDETVLAKLGIWTERRRVGDTVLHSWWCALLFNSVKLYYVEWI